MGRKDRVDTTTQSLLEGFIVNNYELVDLSNMLNIPYGTLYNWLRGFYKASEEGKDKIEALAKELNIKPNIKSHEMDEKNKITKVIDQKKVDGKIVSLVRLHRYAHTFVIANKNYKENTYYDPDKDDARIVRGMYKAMFEWKKIKEDKTEEI
jgi:DNA-binding LacI/PurR family transcriptional regulator